MHKTELVRRVRKVAIDVAQRGHLSGIRTQHELFGRGSATAMGSLEEAEVGVPKAGRGSGEGGCSCDRKMPSKKAL